MKTIFEVFIPFNSNYFQSNYYHLILILWFNNLRYFLSYRIKIKFTDRIIIINPIIDEILKNKIFIAILVIIYSYLIQMKIILHPFSFILFVIPFYYINKNIIFQINRFIPFILNSIIIIILFLIYIL